MRTARNLLGVCQDLATLKEEGKVEGFVNNVQNADKLGGLVEDIRNGMMEYHVCITNYPSPAPLKFAPDLVTARYLRQELSAHRESHPLAFHPHGLIDG